MIIIKSFKILMNRFYCKTKRKTLKESDYCWWEFLSWRILGCLPEGMHRKSLRLNAQHWSQPWSIVWCRKRPESANSWKSSRICEVLPIQPWCSPGMPSTRTPSSPSSASSSSSSTPSTTSSMPPAMGEVCSTVSTVFSTQPDMKKAHTPVLIKCSAYFLRHLSLSIKL